MRIEDIDKQKLKEAFNKMRELTLKKAEVERLQQLIIDQVDIDKLPELQAEVNALQAEINIIDYRKDEIIAKKV